MSTELHLVARHMPSIEPLPIRAIRPGKQVRPEYAYARNRQYLVLPLVIAAHVLIIAVLLQMKPERVEVQEKAEAPISVSLVSDPRSVAEEPKKQPEPPKPVVEHKPKPQPKPQPQKIQPTPQPQPEVSAPEPSPPQSASPAVETPPPAAQPVQPAPVVEKAPPPEPQEPEQVSGIAYITQPDIKYPPISRRMREEGVVVLHIVISAKGELENIKVKTSSGFSRLDDAAIEAMKKARFMPYKKNNKPVSSQTDAPIRFELN